MNEYLRCAELKGNAPRRILAGAESKFWKGSVTLAASRSKTAAGGICDSFSQCLLSLCTVLDVMSYRNAIRPSVGADVMPQAANSPPCINKSLRNVKCSLCPLGASRTSPPTDGGLTLSLSIAKMQLLQVACQKPAQIPLRHDTGDSPAVSCPADTTQGDSPRYPIRLWRIFAVLLRCLSACGHSAPQNFDSVAAQPSLRMTRRMTRRMMQPKSSSPLLARRSFSYAIIIPFILQRPRRPL